jgi:hypothetical protein
MHGTKNIKFAKEMEMIIPAMIVVLYELLSHLTVRTGNNGGPESGPVTKNETKNLNIRRSTGDYRYTVVFNSINFVTTSLQLYNRTQLIYHDVSYCEHFTLISLAALLAEHRSAWHGQSSSTCVAFSSAMRQGLLSFAVSVQENPKKIIYNSPHTVLLLKQVVFRWSQHDVNS